MTDAPARSTGGARVLATLAVREVRELVRDGRLRAAALVLALLLATTLAAGMAGARAADREVARAAEAATRAWLEQEDKNPHVAAHHGLTVFKPRGALAFLEPGVEAYLGRSLRLVAHRRGEAAHAAAADRSFVARLGALSTARALQLFLPLLAIALGFGAWTLERERGTFRLLLSTGVSAGRLALGKALGLALGALVLLSPAAVTCVAVAALGAPGGVPWGRLVLAVAVHGVLFVTALLFALAVSQRARSSRAALVALLGAWTLTVWIAPRAVATVTPRLWPVPSAQEVIARVERDLREGLPGGAGREPRVEELTSALLEREGFRGAETLMSPALLASIELRAEAAFEDEVVDHHFGLWARAAERRERALAWLSWLSPTETVAIVSRALAGTDPAEHRRFSEAAERHRRAVVERLNRELGERGGDDAWSLRTGRELWQRIPPFRQEPPPLLEVLRSVAVSLGAVVAWCCAASLAFAATARRLRGLAE